ncbi:MAG: ABC transporter substrate-binding protein [Isosphaeraceae bacterium]
MIERERSARRGVSVGLALAIAAGVGAFPGAIFGQATSKDDTSSRIDLLGVRPFDRVILNDGTSLEIEPILPRPLPSYDPVKEAKKKKAEREIPPEGNIGLPGEPSNLKSPAEEDESERADVLVIHLTQGDIRDYKVKRASIKSIEYFEDMLLAQADRLILARDFTHAFECDLRVRALSPKWRGLEDQVNRLLFAEGNAAILDGNTDKGLRLLGELFHRKPDYPGLADRLATSYSGRATRAFDIGLYALGRRIIHDAEPLAPNHVLLRGARDRFLSRARELFQSASEHKGTKKLDLIAETLRVWPALEGAEAAYREAFVSQPTLNVGVTDIPRSVGPWVRSPADDRITRLLYLPLMSSDDDDARMGKRVDQIASGVTTTELGRRLVVKLRKDVAWSDGSRPVSAVDVARALTDTADPTGPRYLGRWANLLDRVEISEVNPTQVDVRLTRAFLKPTFWLLGPIGPVHGGSDGRVATLDRGRELVVSGRFQWAPQGTDRGELLAVESGESAASRENSATVKLRRIQEMRYPSASQALGAFYRGEVSLLAHLPPDRVAEISSNADFKVGKYSRPVIHRIDLDGRNPALRNRNLRRGLSYAIDRRSLLEETILKRPSDATNLVADGIFPRGSYADAPDVKPLGYDPLLARMLVAAARKELGGQPIKLNLEYPAFPEAQVIVPKLAEAFRLAGVETVALEKRESELESEIRGGRPFDMVFRVASCDDPVVEAGPLLVAAYDAPPSSNGLGSAASPRIVQLLLELERAPEWPTAKALVLQVDRESRDELPVLPLWQVEDHFAWRTCLKGPGPLQTRLYEEVPSWEVEPWFARDPW